MTLNDRYTYTVRTTSPEGLYLPYYMSTLDGGWTSSIRGNTSRGEETGLAGATVLNNCVGYAAGRMVEMHNQLYPSSQITSASTNIYNVFAGLNAQEWYQTAINEGFETGSEPKNGAVGVYYDSSHDIGHVLNFEQQVNGLWYVSEGHYYYNPEGTSEEQWGSWDYTYANPNYDWQPDWMGYEWSTIGFIYIGDGEEKRPTPKTAPWLFTKRRGCF